VIVEYYFHNGKKVTGDAAAYSPGDELHLKCKVLDSKGKPTTGELQQFYVGSKDLKNGVDWSFTGRNTWHPVVRFSANTTKRGTVKSYCEVDGVVSENLSMLLDP
jgi:hypothetical protein